MPEHTIAENLTRLQNAKTAIGNAITAKGGTVGANDGLEDFASDIASIPSGGGDIGSLIDRSITALTIPTGTSNIGKYVFYDCTNLENVIIPSSVITIDEFAFSNCESLEYVDIPNGVIEIKDYAFARNISLERIDIPKSVTTIADHVFNNAKSYMIINIYNRQNAISGSPWSGTIPQINWLLKDRWTSAVNETSSGTTLTTSVSCIVGDLIVATFENLGGEYTLPSGWTLLGDSGAVSAGGYTQRTGMAYKIAESTTESFTLTQTSSSRIFTNLIAISGASIGTFSGFTKNETNNTITATKPQGLVIWTVSTMWWGSKWEVTPSGDKEKISTKRCENFLDQSNDTTVTFTTDTTQPAGGLTCASLTITGIDNFWYYDEPT